MNSILTKEQEDMINFIDSRLDILLNNMDYENYVEFLKSDDYMQTYDDVLGYYEINYFPEAFLSGLTSSFLSKVLDRVNNKIKELNLE